MRGIPKRLDRLQHSQDDSAAVVALAINPPTLDHLERREEVAVFRPRKGRERLRVREGMVMEVDEGSLRLAHCICCRPFVFERNTLNLLLADSWLCVIVLLGFLLVATYLCLMSSWRTVRQPWREITLLLCFGGPSEGSWQCCCSSLSLSATMTEGDRCFSPERA